MLKSKESNIRAFVKFTNTSHRLVQVQWVNFSGENVHYKDLEPRQSCVINTFCTHPWIFVCPDSGERLQINHSEVFLPEAWFKYILKSENGQVSVGRQEALIHFPVRSLKDSCVWKILLSLDCREVDRLEIPKSLKAEILQVYLEAAKYSESGDNDRDEGNRQLRQLLMS